MRFTTWPSLKGAFIIFTVTLPSLILADNPNIVNNPAPNGQIPGVEIHFVNPPNGNAKYHPGENDVISWYIEANPTGANLTGRLCDIFLVPAGNGTNYTLATQVPIQLTGPTVVGEHEIPSSAVIYPSDVTPGINYSVEIESNVGIWTSDPFQFESS